MGLKQAFIGLAAVAAEESSHPVVEMAANTIEIQVRGNSDYFGPLFIGDDYRENHMIYDTMSDWTIVVGDNSAGSNFPGNYNEKLSTTARPQTYGYNNETMLKDEAVNMGTVNFSGFQYKDQMCLKQMRNIRTDNTGSYCLKEHKFLLANRVFGEFEANGVVGLAPSGGDNSIIEQLYNSGQIKEKIIGINYENTLDTDQQSAIILG